jgi:hypothetical protein
MARDNLKCIMYARVAFAAGLLAVIAAGTSFAPAAVAQETVTPSLAPTVRPAPIGHRQPRPSDLPPSVQREEQDNGPAQGNVSARDNAGKDPRNPRITRTAGEQTSNAVPAFDPKRSCEGTEVAAVNPGRNLESCVRAEETARDQLKTSWSEFLVADRAECVSAGKIGGPPSYIELLTCLEIARDVRRVRKTSPETTGAGGANDSREDDVRSPPPPASSARQPRR